MSVLNFKRITPLLPHTISMIGPHLTLTTKDGETINFLGGTNYHNAKPITTNNLPTPTTNHKTSKVKTHHTNNYTNHQPNNVTNHFISDKTFQTTKPLLLNAPLKKLSDPYTKRTRSLGTFKGEPKLNYPP
ncbi:hypothetical protein PIB30_079104 [Stylosanthes scabra]|uniref:Uncharacterized protein n=1 Tax=Stylosanthes scabra TaxID=79078 RepID=A0ABU6UPU0_9FABA|nr:hypothetical protein [Stylosanthes scabra]